MSQHVAITLVEGQVVDLTDPVWQARVQQWMRELEERRAAERYFKEQARWDQSLAPPSLSVFIRAAWDRSGSDGIIYDLDGLRIF